MKIEISQPDGRLLKASGETLQECLSRISQKASMPVTFKCLTSRKQIEEILTEYEPHNRETKSAQIDDICAAMEEGRWASDHPNIAYTTDGRCVNGGHCMEGFLKTGLKDSSKRLEEIEMVYLLGEDPKMAGRYDTGVRRSHHQQTPYIQELDRFNTACAAFARKAGRKNPAGFHKRGATAFSYIYYCYVIHAHSALPAPVSNKSLPSVRNNVFNHPSGIHVAAAFQDSFIDFQRWMDSLEAEHRSSPINVEPDYVQMLTKAEIFVPCMILFKVNKRRYLPVIRQLLVSPSSNDPKNPLFAGNLYIKKLVMEERSTERRSPKYTARRICEILNYVCAHDHREEAPKLRQMLGNAALLKEREAALKLEAERLRKKAAEDRKAKIKVPKVARRRPLKIRPRDRELVKDGGVTNVWGFYTYDERQQDKARVKAVMQHFLDKIKI